MSFRLYRLAFDRLGGTAWQMHLSRTQSIAMSPERTGSLYMEPITHRYRKEEPHPDGGLRPRSETRGRHAGDRPLLALLFSGQEGPSKEGVAISSYESGKKPTDAQ